MLLDHFFFGRLALSLKMVEEPKVPTLAVDGKHIFYNADFVLTLNDDLLKSAIAHEIMHCVFEHIFRRGGRDPMRWNCAGDYAINLILKKAGFPIGKDWLLDPKYDGMSAEAIYEQLPKGFGNGSGQSPLCDIRDGATGPADRAAQELEWKVTTAQAASEAIRHGNMPAGFERFLDELVNPKVPWNEVLQRFITQLTRDDFSWRKANRRFVAQGLYMPSLQGESMGPITVVVDTSGSITNTVLSAFQSEIQAIVAQTRPEKVQVIYADAAVNHVDEFARGEEIELKPHGGGGTDFRPAIALAGEESPLALVYLTDLYGPCGDEPDFPVLWCCTTDQKAPWGETVQLELA